MNGDQPNEPRPVQPPEEAVQNNDQGKPAGWQMPKPVFQQSSGYLPQGYIEQFGSEIPRSTEPSPAAPEQAPSEAPLTVENIEPQPDITEQLEPPAPTSDVRTQPKKSGSGKVVLLVLGILAMIAFLFGFLALVYFLFLAPSGSSSGF